MFKKKEKEFKEELAEPKAKPAAAAAAAAAADVIEAMGDGLIIADLDGNIISMNKAMEEYLAKGGINAKKFIGKSSLDLPTIRPEDVEKFAGLIGEAIKKGRVAGPLEVLDRLGGWDSFTVSLLKDAEGNPCAVFAVVRDITELKRLEEERIKAVSAAAAADKARAEESIKFTKELQEKIKDLEDFRNLTVGRELKMKKMEEEMEKMKQEMEELKKKLRS